MRTCLTFAFSLLGLSVPEIHPPPFIIHVGSEAQFKLDLDIPSIEIPEVDFLYGQNKTTVTLTSGDVSVRFNGILESSLLPPEHLSFEVDVELAERSSIGFEMSSTDSCDLALSRPLCNLHIKNLRVIHPAIFSGLDTLLSHLLTSNRLNVELCLPMMERMMDFLETPHDMEQIISSNSTLNISQSRLVMAGINAVNALPMDTARITATILDAATINLDMDLVHDFNLTYKALQMHLPDGLQFGLDASLSGICSPWDAQLAECNFTSVTLSQLTLIGAGLLTEVAQSNLGSQLLAKANAELATLASAGRFNVSFMQPDTNQAPDWRIYGPMLVAFAIAVPVVWYFSSYRRTCHESPRNKPFTKLARWLLFLDFAVLTLCSINIMLYVWMNMTPSTDLRIGGTLVNSVYSMSDSVSNFWHGGMKLVAIFITLFSGTYPYLKLIGLIYFGVFRRSIKSRTLLFIDVLGKLSLFDVFTMFLLANSFVIKGVVTVYTEVTMYYFLLAVLLSLCIGNICTGILARLRYHRQLELIKIKEEEEQTRISQWNEEKGSRELTETDTTPPPSDTPYDDLFLFGEKPPKRPKRPTLPLPYKTIVKPWIVTISFCAIAIGCGIIPMVMPSFQFEFTGPAVLFMGKSKVLSVWDMCQLNNKALASTVLVTVSIIPVLLAGAFPFVPHLASWFAPDVFMLAALVTVTQSQKFITSTHSKFVSEMLQVEPTLLWPLGFYGISAFISIVITVRYILRK